jgi:hypothetical protein
MKPILPIAAAALLLAPAAAHAAPYRVYACDGPDDGPLSLRPLETFELPEQSMNHDDHCREPYGEALFEWAGGMTLDAELRGGVRLRAADGTTLTHVRWTGAIGGVTGTGVRVELDSDRGLVGAWGADLGLDTRTFPLPAGTDLVELRQVCRAVRCFTAGPARTTIRALTVTLDDPEPPTAAELRGLAERTTAHGNEALTLTASDRGSGVASARLVVDGAARTVGLGCAPLAGDARGFQSTTPCPASAPVELDWASAGVRDGAHTVSAMLEDAAGNVRTVVGPRTIVSDNAPPVAGAVTITRAGRTLTAAPSGFDGQDVAYAYEWQRCAPACEEIDGATRGRYELTAADAGHDVRATVTATDLGGATKVTSEPVAIEPPPAVTATPTPALVPTAPTAVFAAPVPVMLPAVAKPTPHVTLSRRTIKLAYGQRAEIRGRVTDASGAPLAGATLDVVAELKTPGAKPRREGGIGTARDGRFTYVAPAGASRDLKLGARTVTLLVRAAGTLRATRKGRVVTLSGRLRGGHIPRWGLLVELSANGRTVRLVRTDGRGAFTARLVVGATKPSFRAKARKDSSWPFVPALVGSPVSA